LTHFTWPGAVPKLEDIYDRAIQFAVIVDDCNFETGRMSILTVLHFETHYFGTTGTETSLSWGDEHSMACSCRLLRNW